LLKEVLDNSIDEFVMGAGKTIEVSCNFQSLLTMIKVKEIYKVKFSLSAFQIVLVSPNPAV